MAQFSHAKSTTFLYSENNKWIQDTISIDGRGWPRLDRRNIFASKPTSLKPSAQFFSLQNKELTGEAGLTLWPVTNEWNWNWELKYTEWVKTEIDASWWKKHNIPTDCADVILSARWIFARINGLPAANRLISGAWFTQNSVKPGWENLPTAPEWYNDQRFLTALNFLLNQTFTHSLWIDSYPVEINATALLPGGYHLQIHDDTGHTQFIYKVGTQPDEVPMLTLNSTVPREVRDLMEFIFMVSANDPKAEAFLRMRWPKWDSSGQVDLVAPDQMPHYSLEQFAPDFIRSPRDSFWKEVFYRLNPRADYNRITLKVLQQIMDMFKARVQIVEDGYRICHATPCAAGTKAYDAWSTPSRDNRILESIYNYEILLSEVTSSADLRRLLGSTVLTMDGYDHTLSEFIQIWLATGYSSDPNDAPHRRWGL